MSKVVFVEPLPRRIETDGLVVLVDILRATSTIVSALAFGAEVVRPVVGVEEALALKEKGYLVAGERGGLPPEGFDLGNSPLLAPDLVAGKRVALTTTNGTQAVGLISSASEVVAGAFLNLSAVVQAAQRHQELVVLCAGTEGHFSLEDFLYAAFLLKRLPGYKPDNDSAWLARDWGQSIDDPAKVIRYSRHAQRLMALGLAQDVSFCARVDLFRILPVLTPEGFKSLPA
ncbi:2-phosphosulfolactate phosphatase [Thermosulfuriphilus sp.]